jgi:bla regulator protein BlaR1
VISIANHLWHCTAFAVVASLFAMLLRSYDAKLRFWVWFAASVKFLVPFSILMTFGARTAFSPSASRQAQISSPLPVAVRVAQPFGVELPLMPTPKPVRSEREWPAIAMAALWISGCSGLALKRWRDWQVLRRAMHGSRESRIAAEIPVRFSKALLEPAVVGWRRPVLLLPHGIADQLSEPQLRSVLVHEECHARRKDNILASIHMLVELLFWFHPLVWWIGARMIAERERACDEEVLRRGAEPRTYVEGILAVCRMYARSPLTAAPGVTGWSLKKRIEEIMINRRMQGLGLLRTAGLIVAGLSIVATPVITGIFNSARLLAQPAATPRFQSVSVRSCQDLPNTRRGSGYSNSGGVLRTGCVQLADERGLGLIERAWGRRWPALLPVKGQPEWFASDLYEITGVASAETSPATMEGPMLRAALEDRFRLQMHEESAEVAVYELHVEPAGPKFSRFMEGSCTSQPLSFPVPQLPAGQRYCKALVAVRPPAIDAEGATLQEFSRLLSSVLVRPVVDKTGLSGQFTIHIEFSPDASTPGYLPGGELARFATAPTPGKPTMTGALEQLGLRIGPGTGAQTRLIIDHVEKPVTE